MLFFLKIFERFDGKMQRSSYRPVQGSLLQGMNAPFVVWLSYKFVLSQSYNVSFCYDSFNNC